MIGRGAADDEDLPDLEMLDVADPTRSETTEAGTEQQASLRMVVLAIGVVVAVGVLSWIFSASGDDPAADAPPSTTPSVTLAEPGANVVDPLEPQAYRPSSIEETLEMFSAQGLSGGVAYHVDQNLVTVDFADGSVGVGEPTVRIDRLIADLVVVVEGDRSMATDLTRRDVGFLISSGAAIHERRAEAEYVLIEETDGELFLLVGLLDRVPQLNRLELPSGSELLAVPGQDVFVIPRSGGTYRPTGVGFERVSEGRIIAGSTGGWIEETCSHELVCEVALVQNDGRRQVLDLAVQSPPHLAPDASRLLYETEDGAFLLHLPTGAVAAVELPAGVRPKWSPDSSFMVGLRVLGGRTELWALDVESRASILVDLALLRVPAPTGASLVVYG